LKHPLPIPATQGVVEFLKKWHNFPFEKLKLKKLKIKIGTKIAVLTLGAIGNMAAKVD